MRIFNLLKTNYNTPKITDSAVVDKKYKYWRIRILYSMFVTYAIYYFTRKSFTFVAPEMLKLGVLDKVEVGLMATVFYIVYGISKFISGMISDKANPQYFMSIGLIITGLTNIAFGLTSSFYIFLVVWLINGFFQGWGWPPCGKLLTHWYSQRERGTWWGVWNTSHNVGGFLIPIIVGLVIQYYNWRYAMAVPGVIAIIIGFWTMNRLRDVPETIGLPIIEEYKNDWPADKESCFEKKASTKEILFKYILNNRYIWMLCLIYVMVYIIRTGINDWGAIYLTSKGYSTLKADTCLSFFEVGGFFGSLLSGIFSDRIFKGLRGPVNLFFSLGIIGAILVLWLVPGQTFFIHAATIFAIGFFVFGPQMLVGIVATEVSHREAAGASTGFLGLFGYIGAALSGYPIGLITHYLGWHGFFVTMVILGVITTLLFLPMYSIKVNPKYAKGRCET